ncbi:MAG: hypothetical protein K6D97_09195 [Clostridia bacterium]|nr:hypothetical protein [Clostridia bacterium]
MIGEELYRIYAPPNAKWTEWVRPVPFVFIDRNAENVESASIFFQKRNATHIFDYDSSTAIFVDLPEISSLELGVSLAEIGYRPIPIFNGVDEPEGSKRTTDNHTVQKGLILAGKLLKNIEIKSDANPAFLVDTERLNTYRENESVYDNSWDVYEQDIPSAKYFKENGIDKIIIISSKVHRDLKKIFLKFQDGIDFYLTDGYSPIKKIKENFK